MTLSVVRFNWPYASCQNVYWWYKRVFYKRLIFCRHKWIMQLKGFTQITQVKWLLPIYQSQKCDAKWKSVMGWLFNLILTNCQGLPWQVKWTHTMNLLELEKFDLAMMGAAAKVVRGKLLSPISSLLDAGLNRAAAQSPLVWFPNWLVPKWVGEPDLSTPGFHHRQDSSSCPMGNGARIGAGTHRIFWFCLTST